MKGIDKNSFQPIANRTRSRCRDVSQSFDLSETITEKYEDMTEKIEEFKKDVSHASFLVAHAYETHEWSRVNTERHGTVTKDRFYCTYLFVLLCPCRVECAREVVAGALHHLLCSCIHL